MEVLDNEVNLFEGLAVNYSVLENKNEIVYSKTSFATSPRQIAVSVPQDLACYTSLKNSFVMLKLKYVKENGTQIEDPAKVSVVNNIVHSLFSSIRVYMNDTLVSPSEANPGYVHFIQFFLEPADVKKSFRTIQLYYEDDLTSVEKCNQSNPQSATNKNDGLTKRATYFASSKEVTLVAPLLIPPHTTSKLLLPGVKLDYLFDLQQMDFFTMTAEPANTYQYLITEFAMVMNRVRLEPSLMLAHQTALQTRNAIYRCPYVQTHVQTIAQGSWSFQWANALVRTLYLPSFPHFSYFFF